MRHRRQLERRGDELLEGEAVTPAQTKTVEGLQSEGFTISAKGKEIIRLARGADKRIVMADGTQKRAYHTHYQEAR
ncbi:hypothetical protein D3C78_1238010 [compost metagenome]